MIIAKKTAKKEEIYKNLNFLHKSVLKTYFSKQTKKHFS